MAAEAPTLRGSAPLFTFRGIRVYVHWTFLILIGYIAFMGYRADKSALTIAAEVGLVLIVFVCVVLHEFGHALMAQRFGVDTKDITLLPIGGIANLKRMPEEPRQEFWITVAGPMVNLVIAGLAFIVIAIMGVSMLFGDLFLGATTWTQVLLFIFGANLMLFLFNLIPAFPMDGGRILRSLLSMRMARDKATRIAAGVGRFFAIAFVVFGLMNGQPFLALIGVFIFMAAGAESRMVEQQTALRGIRVKDVMRTRFWIMPATATVQQAVDELLAGGDKDLVLTGPDGGYTGILTRRDLVQALTNCQQLQALGQLAVSQPPAVAPADAVNTAYTSLLTGQFALLPVMHDGRLVGVLEPENLTEFLLVKGALREAQSAAEGTAG
jgi:Zn-dependent protease/predicted transcriptional regulator